MTFYLVLGMLLTCSLAHADVLIGDANGDGKVDARDLAPAYDLIWRKQGTELLRVAAMDIDGNGVVDSDDYIDLESAIKKGTPLGSRPTPDSPLKVVPRSADAFWWKPKVERFEAEINSGFKKINHVFDEAPTEQFLPGRIGKRYVVEALTQYEILEKDVGLAAELHLLDGGKLDRACGDVEFLSYDANKWKRVLESWKNDRPAGREYIESCAKRLKPGTYHRMGVGPAEICVTYYALPHPRMIPYSYKIEVANGRMKVRLPARIEYSKEFDRNRLGQVEQKWIRATQCAADFWSRYGIDLELDYETEPLFSITLHPGTKRSDMFDLYIDDSPLETCAMVTHELGHHLGFKDEYSANVNDCPNRGDGEPNSLMNYKHGGNVYAIGLSGVHLTRGNLDTVLGGLCGTPPKDLK